MNQLVNIQTVKILQRVLNPAGLQTFLENLGFPVNLENAIENLIKTHVPVGAHALASYIAAHYDYFIHGNPEDVTRDVNNYLNNNMECFDFLGYNFCYNNSEAQNRKYLFYGIAGIGIYFLIKNL